MKTRLLLLSLLLGATALQALTPDALMCELLAKPGLIPVTDPTPEFSWGFKQGRDEDFQTAWQIQVATDTAHLRAGKPDLWDSGKKEGSDSIQIAYEGDALPANRQICWRVRVWDRKGKEGPWSTPYAFQTATKLDQDRALRYPLVQRHVRPVSITTNAAGNAVIDFGRAAFGWVELLTLRNAPKDRGDFILHVGEKIKENAVDRKPGGTIRYQRVRGALTRPGVYRAPFTADKRNTTGAAVLLPPEIGVIMPFRYVEVEAFPFPITAETFRQIAITYPFDNQAADFVSSEPALDQVYRFCKYSIRATTFAGVYVDGDRERIPYEADAYINQLCHYNLDREFTLARYSHEYLMVHPTWPTEWKQHSIMMAWQDWMHTGNTESIERWYNDLKEKKLLLFCAREKDGMLQTAGPFKNMKDGSRDIVDWPYPERDGFDFRPVNTVINAFHLLNLRQMAEMADAIGKTEDARSFREREEKLRKTFHSLFYNPNRGCYVDGEGSTHASAHANMTALAFGLVPAEEIPRVADFLRLRKMACSVYGAQYLLEALFEGGLEDEAIHLMMRDDRRSWINMMRAGSTISMEAWDILYKPNQDWNHAWGAVPANIIPRYVLGVRPITPGFGKILIRPQTGSLTAVEGFIPTIRGKISVGVRNTPETYKLTVTIPYNTTARVELPAIPDAVCRVNGSKVKPELCNNRLCIDEIPSGKHEILLQK